METVVVSPKYQVVIPKKIRNELGISEGQRLQAIAYEGRIELVKIEPIATKRGFLKGMPVDFEREADRL
ncbi:MAG: AbrB/MazE/SpoVT family DNA-binding domain-containing protein [Campylobacterales bacterium]